jgi:ferric-dicitrate binding protein FerR (iron transport regulator)
MDRSNQILRVLNGEASSAEEAALHEMMANDPALKEEFEDMKLFYSFREGGDPPPLEPFEKIKAVYYERQRKKKLVRRVVGSQAVLAILASILWIALPGKTSDLVFVNQTIGAVVDTLESEYALEIEVDNSALLTCRFTGSFLHISSAEEVLPAIVAATNARAQVIDGRIVITGGICL